MSNLKTCAQQRASLRPMKYNTFHDDSIRQDRREDDDSIRDDDTVDSSFESDSQRYNSGISQDSRAETMILAEFLSTTGPEQYIKDYSGDHKEESPYMTRTTRLLNKLRKKSAYSAPPLSLPKKTHVPLCDPYEDRTVRSASSVANTFVTADDSSVGHLNFTNKPTKKPSSSQLTVKRQSSKTQTSIMRDSGVYSETASEKDFNTTTVFYGPSPMPQSGSVLGDLHFPPPPKIITTTTATQIPRRPPPLPPSVASAAIISAIRSVPEAALKRKSVRIRHVQVQTTDVSTPINSDKQTCPHCRQGITQESLLRSRRPSCPPALASGPTLKTVEPEPEPVDDAKALLAMIMTLQSQLEEEKQCRLKLEQAIYNRQS